MHCLEWLAGDKWTWTHPKGLGWVASPLLGAWVLAGPSHRALNGMIGATTVEAQTFLPSSLLFGLGQVNAAKFHRQFHGCWSRSRLSRWMARSMRQPKIASSSWHISLVMMAWFRPRWKITFSTGSLQPLPAARMQKSSVYSAASLQPCLIIMIHSPTSLPFCTWSNTNWNMVILVCLPFPTLP